MLLCAFTAHAVATEHFALSALSLVQLQARVNAVRVAAQTYEAVVRLVEQVKGDEGHDFDGNCSEIHQRDVTLRILSLQYIFEPLDEKETNSSVSKCVLVLTTGTFVHLFDLRVAERQVET